MKNRGGNEPSPEGVCICLLGRFEVEWRGRSLPRWRWTRQKVASLLQRLALERRLHKEQVIEALWPESDLASGNNNFHQTLHLLRRTLDDGLGAGCAQATFDFTAGLLRLRESVTVDVDEFEWAAGAARSEAELEEALALYQGELLPADLYAEWTQHRRERLHQLYRQTAWKQAAIVADAGRYDSAVARLLPLLAQEPADERMHRELMRLYAASGRRHEALRQFQTCREALAAELGIEPSAETLGMYEGLLRGELEPRRIGTKRVGSVPERANHLEAPLVGRRDELAALLTSTAAGRGGVTLIEGEAGVGKTRLVNEVVALRTTARWIVIRGSAYELEGQASYQCFDEAFDDFIEHRRSPLENPLSSYRPLGVSDLQQEHTALFRSVLNFLATVAATSPVLLFIDDLHAADEPSIALFHYIARNARKTGLQLIGTYRQGPRPSLLPFNRLLHSLYRERLVETISIEPLSSNESAELVATSLGSTPDERTARKIYEAAEGNPFFTLEIVRAMDREGSGTALQVPEHLLDMLRERVGRLTGPSEDVLSAAAVLGREFQFAILRLMSSEGDDEIFRVLDGALAGLILEDTGEGYRFRHSLIRQSLYGALSSAKRRWLHGRAAVAIRETHGGSTESLRPHLEALAHHYARSEEKQAAIPFLLQAGEKAAAIYSLEQADDYFRQAEELLNEFAVDDRQLRWMVYFYRGWWGLILARAPSAVGSIMRALALPRDEAWSPGADELVRAHRIAARSLITAGNMAEAESHLLAAGDLLTDEASVDAADYHYDLALWKWHGGEPGEALETARTSLRIAEETGDEGAQARALEMVALAGHSLGEARAWQPAESRRSELLGPNADVIELFDIHLCLWEYSLFGDYDYSTIREVVEATSRQARRMGAVRADALCHCFLGALEFQAGRWPRAEAVLRSGLGMYRKIGAAAGEAHCCHRLAILETARGKFDDAMSLLEDGIVAAQRSLLRSHCLTRLYSVIIRNRLEAGDSGGAEAALEAALSESVLHGNCNTCDSLLWPEAVSLRVYQGDLAEAAAFCEELSQAAERHGSPLWRAMVERSRGELALAGGRVTAAEQLLEAACSGFEAVGFDFALARSLQQLAEARSMSGFADLAREDRERADRLLQRLISS